MRVSPLGVAPFLRALPIEPCQIGTAGRLDARRLRESRQKLLIRFARVASHDAPQRGIGLERRRVDADRLAVDEIRRRQHLQDPGKHRAVRLQIDQPTRPRNRRVLRWRLIEAEAEKAAERQRVGRTPRDAALRVDTLEVADQQQTEIRAGRQTGSAPRRRIERRTLRFDELVEPVRIEDLIQSLIERMAARRRQFIRRNPQSRRPCAVLPTTHGHSGSVVRRIDRVDPLLG